MSVAIDLEFFARVHIQDGNCEENYRAQNEEKISHRPRYDISRIINVNMIIRKKDEFRVNCCMISVICYYF